MSYCIPPPKQASKINQLKNAPSLVLWGLLGRHCDRLELITSATPTRSGRLLRLRRTAHEHSRRGACRSPCPQSLRSLAGSTPSGDCVPQCLRHRLPLSVWQWRRFFQKSFGSRPRRGKEQRGVAGDSLANRSTLPQPPRGRNASYGVPGEGLHGRKRSVPGTPKAWQAGTP